jgi:hypothetical protein
MIKKGLPLANPTSNASKPGPSTLAATTNITAGPASAAKPSTPVVGAMLPPPVPAPPKAILEPEMDALSLSLRVRLPLRSLVRHLKPSQSVAVKTGEIYAFYSDTRKLCVMTLYSIQWSHSLHTEASRTTFRNLLNP